LTLRALILDVDGTLADTEEVHRTAFNDAFAEMGLNWNWSRPTYAHLLKTTGGKERLTVFIDSMSIGDEEKLSLRNQVAAIHARKTELYAASVLEGRAPLRDGVLRLLDEAAAAGVSLAIATTTTYANVEALLSTNLGSDAMQRFAVVGAGDVVRHKKPAPDIYHYVLEKLHVSADESVAIEDSVNGLQSAKAAGIFTVVTPSYWTLDEDFSSADLVLPSLGSADRPLPSRAEALVGHTVLGIRELSRHLNAFEGMRTAT
jgi:beta-phosphoglucomutase-like phosphatase (HAD superfamily)